MITDEDEEHYEQHIPKLLRGRGMCCASIASIIFVVFLLVPAGVFGTIKLFTGKDSKGRKYLNFADFHPPPDSILGQTENVRWSDPSTPGDHIYNTPEYVHLTTSDGSSWTSNELRRLQLYALTAAVDAAMRKLAQSGDGYAVPRVRGLFIDCYNNHTLVGGRNNESTIFVFEYLTGRNFFYRKAETYMKSLDSTLLLDVTWSVSGISQLNAALQSTVLSDLAKIDMVAVPVGLVIFCIFVRSLHAVIAPVLCIIASIAPALGAAFFLHDADVRVTGFAPELMACVVVALSIDFCLFMMSRLREVHEALPPRIRAAAASSRTISSWAVWTAFTKVAHNITISAISIAAAFGSIAFLPTDFVRSIALVCMFGTLFCLLAALTLLPGVSYFLYPVCFENCFNDKLASCLPSCCCNNDNGNSDNISNRQQKYDAGSGGGRDVAVNNNNNSSNATSVSLLAHQRQEADDILVSYDDDAAGGGGGGGYDDSPLLMAASPLKAPSDAPTGLYARVARMSTVYPKTTILAILAASAPFIVILVLTFGYDSNYLSNSPHTIPAFKHYVGDIAVFKNKIDTPLYLVLKNNNNPQQQSSSPSSSTPTPLLDIEELWPLLNFAVRTALDPASGVHVSSLADIDSMNVFGNEIISWEKSRELLKRNNNTGPEALQYATLLQHLSNANFRSTQNFLVAFRPTGVGPSWGAACSELLKAAQTLCEKTRAFQQQQIKKSNATSSSSISSLFVGYYGPNVATTSVEWQVMKHFNLVIGLTLGVLFVLVLLFLRSVFFTVVMISTICLSVAVSFGIVMLALHYSWMSEYVDKFYWIIALLSFSISCVISLDYSCFLMIRVLEFRRLGFDDVESTVRAISRTGPVIGVAAVIMVSALGALLFANTTMLQQFGLALSLSVLIDAFVVRPLLVPALVALCPSSSAAWWPRAIIDSDTNDKNDLNNVHGIRQSAFDEDLLASA